MQLTENIITQFFALGRIIKLQLHSQNPGITLQQVETLRLIHEKQAVTMKDLADFLAITPPSATVIADGLVRPGFLGRRRDPKNRRAVYLHITKKGREHLDKACKIRSHTFKKLLNNLNKSEQLTLFRLMRKLSESK